MNEQLFPTILFQTARTWREALDKRLNPLGLSQAKWRALLHLSRAEKPLSQKELAKRMGIEGPTLVGLIDRLAKDDWVERRSDLEDRRSKTVHLTEKAQQTLKEIHTISNTLKEEILSSLSESELNQCVEMLAKIKTRLETNS